MQCNIFKEKLALCGINLENYNLLAFTMKKCYNKKEMHMT